MLLNFIINHLNLEIMKNYKINPIYKRLIQLMETEAKIKFNKNFIGTTFEDCLCTITEIHGSNSITVYDHHNKEVLRAVKVEYLDITC